MLFDNIQGHVSACFRLFCLVCAFLSSPICRLLSFFSQSLWHENLSASALRWIGESQLEPRNSSDIDVDGRGPWVYCLARASVRGHMARVLEDLLLELYRSQPEQTRWLVRQLDAHGRSAFHHLAKYGIALCPDETVPPVSWNHLPHIHVHPLLRSTVRGGGVCEHSHLPHHHTSGNASNNVGAVAVRFECQSCRFDLCTTCATLASEEAGAPFSSVSSVPQVRLAQAMVAFGLASESVVETDAWGAAPIHYTVLRGDLPLTKYNCDRLFVSCSSLIV